ncbi:MAG: hypothetical protein CVU57_29525 [Deltaproteobacteria bacterium HGW-Deltaproteobacteria-15]|jgi:hypothetical protein|nr:MAG: hypothetical protein CVU57_29525 [Deltaproteobacteria bacterium HGW-Deltaproteobacteria-15]
MNKEEQAALDVVMKFLDGYSGRNVDDCMSAIAASKSILMVGTNDNEVFRTPEDVRAAFKRDFDKMADIRWGEHRNVHVQASQTLASVFIELPISYQSEGENVQTLFRYALTLVKEGGQWKICAGVASVPFASGTYAFT